MSTQPTVRRLHTDLTAMHHAATGEKKAQASVKTDTAAEKKAMTQIKSQEQAIVDSFASNPTPTPAQEMTALQQMFALGQKEIQTPDQFGKKIAGDKATEKKDATAEKKDKSKALKDLKPAEYHLSLKDTNAARKQLGLKAVNKVIRPPESQGLSKAVTIAMDAAKLESSQHCYDYTQAFGGRTNDGRDPLTKGSNGRITFDCSGFVGDVYKKAGLPSPYTVGFTGTSFDVAGCKNMQKVSQSQAKPGDVVVFPDHIALYIGNGNCVSMGQEGDPKVVSVAAEAAFRNRGIQGFYHPKGS